MIPQFISALIISCSVLLVSQLARLADVLVAFGLTAENVLLPMLFMILPFLSFTIPWAFLFAVILTFGRLSADGEYTAMLASGYSLSRAARPIFAVSVVLYLSAAWCSMILEPWGRREFDRFLYEKTQTELDNMVRFKLQPGVFLNDFLGYTLYAEKMSKDRSTMENVLLAPTGGSGQQAFKLFAPLGGITGSVEEGNLTLSLTAGLAYSSDSTGETTSILKFRRAEIDLLRIFKDKIFESGYQEDDYRSYPPQKLWRYVGKLKESRKKKDRQHYQSASTLLHQRIGRPFSVIIFAFFGVVLGIQDPRHGKSRAFLGGVIAIILSYVFIALFSWLAENGSIPAVFAAWIPNLILLAFGAFWVYQKNRLPLAESAFDPQYFPGRDPLLPLPGSEKEPK